MNKIDIDFDPKLLCDKSTNGVYLTSVSYVDNDTEIKAIYHDYKDGNIESVTVESYPNNYLNYKDLSEMRVATVFKIIEINDNELYKKLDELTEKVMMYNKECRATNITSILATLGAVGFGYAITNMEGQEGKYIAALIASLCILGIGVYSRVQHVKAKQVYDDDCQEIRDRFEEIQNRYQRVKKKVD